MRPRNTPPGTTAQNALVNLPAAAMRSRVLDPGVIVHQLLAANDENSVKRRVRSLAPQNHVQIVACQPSPQVRRHGSNHTVGFLQNLQGRDMVRGGTFLLQPIVIQVGVLPHRHFGDGIVEIGLLPDSQVVLDHRAFAAGADHDQISRVGHECRTAIARGEKNQMDGLRHLDSRGHPGPPLRPQ